MTVAFGSHCVDPCRWEAVGGPPTPFAVGFWFGWGWGRVGRVQPRSRGRIAIATVHTLRPLGPGQAQETLPEPAKPVPRVVRRQRQSAPAAPAATRAL